MTDSLSTARQIALSGMKAQSLRLRTISENIANADSLSETPGGDPYARKVVTFKNVLNKDLEADVVEVDKIAKDKADFGKKYDPNNPAANNAGYVLTPNINPLIELMDMKEAQRSYEANLNVISTTRDMSQKTIDILK